MTNRHEPVEQSGSEKIKAPSEWSVTVPERNQRYRSQSPTPTITTSSKTLHLAGRISAGLGRRGRHYPSNQYLPCENQGWTPASRPGPSDERQHKHSVSGHYYRGGGCRGRRGDLNCGQGYRQQQQWQQGSPRHETSLDCSKSQPGPKRPRKNQDRRDCADWNVTEVPTFRDPPPDPPVYLSGALISESDLLPRLVSFDEESEDDYSSSSSEKPCKANQNLDREQVMTRVKGTPIHGSPNFNNPTSVVAAISLICSGGRVDLAPAVTALFDEARALIDANPEKQPLTVLNKAQNEAWCRWKPIQRPAWLKHVMLKLGRYETPEDDEPVWVQACWVWLHGTGDNEGIVEDKQGRISIAHLEGRSLFRMVTPKESTRPAGVSTLGWSRSFDKCYLLFACPGLYGEILKAYRIPVNSTRHLEPHPDDFPTELSCTVVDFARWYAGKGMWSETADKIAHYAQEKVRALPLKDVIWVSKWLTCKRNIDLPYSEDNWFEPAWAPEVERNEDRQSAPRVRVRKDLLEEKFNEEEVVSVLTGFDLNEYVYPSPPCGGPSSGGEA